MSSTASIDRGDHSKRSDEKSADRSECTERSLVDLDEMKDFRQTAGSRTRAGDQLNDDAIDFSTGDLDTLYSNWNDPVEKHGHHHHKDKKHHQDGDDDQDSLLFTSPFEDDEHGKPEKDECEGESDKPPSPGPLDSFGSSLDSTDSLNPILDYAGEVTDTTLEPSFYTVQPGQTLEDIARMHLGSEADDVDIQRHIAEIMHVNKIAPGDRLKEGTKLSLPGRTADGGLIVINSKGECVTVYDATADRGRRFDGDSPDDETPAVVEIYGSDGTVHAFNTRPGVQDNYGIESAQRGDVLKVVRRFERSGIMQLEYSSVTA